MDSECTYCCLKQSMWVLIDLLSNIKSLFRKKYNESIKYLISREEKSIFNDKRQHNELFIFGSVLTIVVSTENELLCL